MPVVQLAEVSRVINGRFLVNIYRHAVYGFIQSVKKYGKKNLLSVTVDQ